MSVVHAPEVLMKPGCTWAESDMVAAFVWIFSGRNLRHLLWNAADCMRRMRLSALETEDVCQDFAMRRFRRVIYGFDPARGRTFESYVVYCFRRFCFARARVAQRRAARTVSLEAVPYGVAAAGWSPEVRLLRIEARRQVRRAVTALNILDRKLLMLQFWSETTLKERAAAIKSTTGAAKTRTCRALGRLAPELRHSKTVFGIGGAK